MNRRAAIQAMASVGASLTMVAPALADTADTIRIGFITPKTGPLAAFAETDAFVLQALKPILAAGLKVGGRSYKIELLVRDSQSNPNRAADLAAELILREKVALMLTAFAPETTNPVSDQCELHQTPCISTVAPWQPWFFSRGGDPNKGFDWTYHFFWGFEDILTVLPSMWNQVQTNKLVGGLFPNDGDGTTWSDPEAGLPKPLAKSGYKIVDPGRFPVLSTDFSAQIQRFRAERTDIVVGAMIPPDFTTFWNQAQQKSLRPVVVTEPKALCFPSSVEAFGDKGDRLSALAMWTPTYPFRSSLTGQAAAQLSDAYEASTGRQWNQVLGFTHALFEVALDVLKRSSDPLQRRSVRDALVATDLNTVVGPIRFGAVNRNVAKTPLVGAQWRRTKAGKRAYDLVVVDSNKTVVPQQDKLLPLLWS